MKNWVVAFRLKTLPLALGAILMGSRLSAKAFEWKIFVLACGTAILLQVLSNLANDYGDYQKGTDQHRSDRQLTTGDISPSQMFRAVVVFAGLSFLLGIYLLWVSFGAVWIHWVIFLGLGIASIVAAISYTVGKNAYGYLGLGDLFVFVFFGLVGVIGTSFLFNQTWNSINLLPAISYGCLCMGVLNINNMRDISKDVLTNKLTLAAKLGQADAFNYQILLVIASLLTFIAYHLLEGYYTLGPLILLVVGVFHLLKLTRATESKDYNAQLKFLSIGSLLVAIFFWVQLFN